MGKYVLTLIGVYLCLAAMSAKAFHPISSELEFITTYPEYPAITAPPGDAGEMVRRGEYLAKLGDCLACHTTTDGGEAFAGGLPIPTPFGTFYTPNITPDKETGLGSWSREDFVRAMKEGIRPDGSNSFPAFPYVYFNRVTEQDLSDIWAYLQAIPPVSQESLGNTLPFPMNLRLGQYAWKIPFFYPDRGEFEADLAQSKAWNRGKYIVEGLGHCSMCHTPMNLLGASQKRYYLTGALIDGFWAPDITRWGLDGAKRYQVANVFIEGELINQAGEVRGPMADANHNSLQYLSEDDALAIAEYLLSVNSRSPRRLAASQQDQPRLKRGEQVFWNACNVCHVDGEAGAPRLADGNNWWERLRERPTTALYHNAIHGYNNMPAKGACVTCSNEDVQAAVDFILNKALSESQWREYKQVVSQASSYKRSGEAVYITACATCHDEGRLGAPVIANRQQWDPILRKNFDIVLDRTLRGYNAMPPKGGCTSCSGEEVIDAVKYMASKAQAEKDYQLW